MENSLTFLRAGLQLSSRGTPICPKSIKVYFFLSCRKCCFLPPLHYSSDYKVQHTWSPILWVLTFASQISELFFFSHKLVPWSYRINHSTSYREQFLSSKSVDQFKVLHFPRIRKMPLWKVLVISIKVLLLNARNYLASKRYLSDAVKFPRILPRPYNNYLGFLFYYNWTFLNLCKFAIFWASTPTIIAFPFKPYRDCQLLLVFSNQKDAFPRPNLLYLKHCTSGPIP